MLFDKCLPWFMGTIALALSFTTILNAQQLDFQQVNFSKPDSVAALYPKYDLDKLYDLSIKLTEPFSTDVEKFRAIYTWVSTNIENDYGYYKRNKIKREKYKDNLGELDAWEDKFKPMVFEKLRQEYKTVCTGYAYLIKEMSNYVGIDCEIVDGYGRTARANIGGDGIANHSWNVVKLNDKWYLCDATWSSGAINETDARFIKDYEDSYFLSSPQLFIQSHYPLDTFWILQDDNPTLNSFLNRPLVYKAAYRYKVISVYPETFELSVKRRDIIHFQWRVLGEQKLSNAELQIVQGSNTSSYYPTIQKEGNGLFSIGHSFNNKGTYVVHVLLDGAYTFTYTIKVTKS